MTDILAELKQKTRPYHDEIEQYVNLMDENLTREQYGRLLQLFYAFHNGMENLALNKFSKEELEHFDFDNRQKSAWLIQDLEHLGLEPDHSKAPQLPSVESFPALLGSFYVIEGSTMGGQFIAKHLNKTLGLSPEAGCRFFSSYQEKVMPYWKAYQALLEKAESPEIVVHAACDTFAKFNAWFKLNQVSYATTS